MGHKCRSWMRIHLGFLPGPHRPRAHAKAWQGFIRETFGRYLTDDTVKSLLELLQGLQLSGERRKVILVMTDLSDFTSCLTRDHDILQASAGVFVLRTLLR